MINLPYLWINLAINGLLPLFRTDDCTPAAGHSHHDDDAGHSHDDDDGDADDGDEDCCTALK